MPDYRITIAASALREFENLPARIRLRVRRAVDALGQAPRPRGTVKLRGSADLFRLRVGDYRVIYHVPDRERCVDIVRVRHRREVYE